MENLFDEMVNDVYVQLMGIWKTSRISCYFLHCGFVSYFSLCLSLLVQ